MEKSHVVAYITLTGVSETWSWFRLFDLEQSCGDLRYEILVSSNGFVN